MTLIIRNAEPRDTDQLLTLVRDHAKFERTEATITRDYLLQLFISPTQVKLTVAMDQDVILGYTAVTFDYSLWRGRLWAHLDCLFVQTAHRDGGIGRRLLERALAQARAAGADRLEWQTPEWNEAAIRFYRREGAACETKKRFHLSTSGVCGV